MLGRCQALQGHGVRLHFVCASCISMDLQLRKHLEENQRPCRITQIFVRIDHALQMLQNIGILEASQVTWKPDCEYWSALGRLGTQQAF